MTGDVPDEFIPDAKKIIDPCCAECGERVEYGMAGRSEWICPSCAGYFDGGDV